MMPILAETVSISVEQIAVAASGACVTLLIFFLKEKLKKTDDNSSGLSKLELALRLDIKGLEAKASNEEKRLNAAFREIDKLKDRLEK